MCYTGENVLYQTMCSTLITVKPKSVVDTLLCPKCFVFDLCSHISVQGKWLVPILLYLEVSLGYRGYIGCQILECIFNANQPLE